MFRFKFHPKIISESKESRVTKREKKKEGGRKGEGRSGEREKHWREGGVMS